MKSHKKQILRLLENHGDSLSTKQIRGALGLNKTATAKLKAELLKLIKFIFQISIIIDFKF